MGKFIINEEEKNSWKRNCQYYTPIDETTN